jgi:serine O-acetyltransferase
MTDMGLCGPVASEGFAAYMETAPTIPGYFKRLGTAAKGIAYFPRDAAAIFARDPALRGKPLGFMEVPLYASFWAMLFHRISHLFHALGLPFVPRLLSQIARLLTGIEIHPGADIGPGLFIDHGMGVVIGETAVVGRGVTLFHGVTLGGVDARPGRRHPWVGDGAVIGAGAKVLGALYVGEGALIGAQSVVLADVPPGATAVGVPAKILTKTPAADTA